jgi:hypothetical protein
MVQQMLCDSFRKSGPAALMSLLVDYREDSGAKNPFTLYDLWRFMTYTSCSDNWLVDEYRWRSSTHDSRAAYQSILLELQKLHDEKFIRYQTKAGQGKNTIHITKKGTRWVIDARARIHTSYNDGELSSDEEPGVEGISNTVLHLNNTHLSTLTDVGHGQHHRLRGAVLF